MDSNRENKNVNTRIVPARYICQELDCATPRMQTKQKSQEQLTNCLELLLTPAKKCHHKWIQTMKQKPNLVTSQSITQKPSNTSSKEKKVELSATP